MIAPLLHLHERPGAPGQAGGGVGGENPTGVEPAAWRTAPAPRAVKPGVRLGDIGHAIQVFTENQGFSIVREFCGHGIGSKFHEEPQVLHYGRPGTLELLKPGMTFTIEPMINAGKRDIKDGPEKDGWTIVTTDRSLSAQWEHTLAVTATGCEIFTLRDEELRAGALPANVSAARRDGVAAETTAAKTTATAAPGTSATAAPGPCIAAANHTNTWFAGEYDE